MTSSQDDFDLVSFLLDSSSLHHYQQWNRRQRFACAEMCTHVQRLLKWKDNFKRSVWASPRTAIMLLDFDSLDTQDTLIDCRSWYHSPRLCLKNDPWDLIYPLLSNAGQGERAKVPSLIEHEQDGA